MDNPNFCRLVSNIFHFEGDVVMNCDFNLVQCINLNNCNFDSKKGNICFINMEDIHGLTDPPNVKFKARKIYP